MLVKNAYMNDKLKSGSYQSNRDRVKYQQLKIKDKVYKCVLLSIYWLQILLMLDEGQEHKSIGNEKA